MAKDLICDISIPLKFNGEQPNAYGVAAASSTPCDAGELVGDTRLGGSCNFESYTFIPHCNGTHTECVGHITDERISIRDCLQDIFIDAVLISIEPTEASKTDESYADNGEGNDLLITKKILLEALETAGNDTQLSELRISHSKALVIRTLPNDVSKLTQKYGDNIPPYFTTEAMRFIVESGVKHLLVDLPSIDRIYDEGKLANHRIFWNIEPESRATNTATRLYATITELIYVPDNIPDGDYTLNLQIAPFQTDAAPSRPILLKSP